jgi:CRISPR-associated exonuclease Cas4
VITLRPTDIRQFLYCPRIIYFTYVQPVRKLPTLKMAVGAQRHQAELEQDERGRRRYAALPEGERLHNVSLSAPSVGLQGKVDMLIKQQGGRMIPVEFKPSKTLQTRHQYQLVAYAMLVAEQYSVDVPEGYVYSLADRRAKRIAITQERVKYLRDVLVQMRRMIESEALPEPTAGRYGAKCVDCEYRRYCGDR